jgi:hypothetical protein
VGGEHYVDSAFQGGGGNDVPDVGFDYVGGDEVDLVLGVGDAVVGDVAFVGASAFVFGAFDLDAEEVAVVFDGEVVAGHVSPGLGDAESVLGGAGHEAQFGPLAPEFGVLDVDSFVGHFCLEMDSLEKSKAADSSVPPYMATNEKSGLGGPLVSSYLL